MKKSKLEKVYFFLILLLIKTELYDRISIYKRGGTMEQYRIIYDIMKCPNSCLEQSWPFTNKKAYDSANKYVEYYYQSTKIFFEYDLYNHPLFSNLFEMYKKSKNTKYWKLIKLLVDIKTLKELSDKWGENMENPWLRTLEKKLQMFKPFIYDLLIMAYDNKMFNGLDYSNLPPPLADAYKKIKAQRRLDQFYETLKGRPSNLDEDIAAYFLEKEKYELGENKKKKQTIPLEEKRQTKSFTSLRDSAEQCKPKIEESTNPYYNDTDYYETKGEFDNTLEGIKARKEAIDDFVEAFNDSRVMEEYYYEKPDQYQALAQKYKNYLYLGQPNKYYSRDNAEENNEISFASCEFYEAIDKFLRDFASERLTPIEKLALPKKLQDYLDSLDSQK